MRPCSFVVSNTVQAATAGVKWDEIGQVENAAIAGWTWTVPWPLDREEDEISKRC